MEEKEQPLTEEQKRQIRRHARRFLRGLGFDVPDEDTPPMQIDIIDDDGNVIETVYK